MSTTTNPLDTTLRNLTNCDCCTGIQAQTPAEIENFPGLSRIRFRAGSHGQFKASLMAALTDFDFPALAGLRTRDDEDFTIALLDGFSAMADVLTFYSERIANESWLRTAIERRSVLELARGIGYELKPGVAAETWVAFTVEEAEGAPGWADVKMGTQVQSIPGPGEKPQTYETVTDFVARKEWNLLRAKRFRTPVKGNKKIWLKGSSVNVQVGDQILIVGKERKKDSGSERWDVRRVIEVEKENPNDPLNAYTVLHLEYGLGSSFPQMAPSADLAEVHVFLGKANLFGWNAADWNLIDDKVRKHYMPTANLLAIAAQAEWPSYGISDVKDQKGNSIIHLDSVQDSFVPDSWIALQRPGFGNKIIGYTELYKVLGNTTDAKTGFGISAKVSKLSLSGENLIKKFRSSRRETIALGKTERLDDAHSEITTRVEGSFITLDRCTADLDIGRLLIVTGMDRNGVSQVEHVVLKGLTEDVDDPNVTRLILKDPLLNSYDPKSVMIYANAARVTHGESVKNEIVGSGNSGSEHQKFALKQKSLTYTQSINGATSSLSVYVNGVLWKEAPSLYGLDSKERAHIIRNEDDGTTRVMMGDGWFGARLPTGAENVIAYYRKGIGLEGLVIAGQLTQLLNRPLGIRSAKNPAASSGAADPEIMDEARANAPLQTLTLDRVVSLTDYADYSRAFPGVTKAHAVWVWTQHGRGVLVHIAGPDEAEFSASNALPSNLAAALLSHGDPLISVTVRSGKVARFVLAGTVTIASNRIMEDVKLAVDKALINAFSYDMCDFGQAVALSEILQVIHSVSGVLHVDLTKFHLANQNGSKSVIPALVPHPGDGILAAAIAEIPVIDESSLINLIVSLV
jgi:hypothetical protein